MSTGAGGAGAYTRAKMETETVGERRLADVDALYAEAQRSLSVSANQLRALTARLHEMHALDDRAWQQRGGDGTGVLEARDQLATLALEQAHLARLELITRGLEEMWRFLERGLMGEWAATGRSAADELALDDAHAGFDAMSILEAQEQERARVAEELHDGPAQALANAVFKTEIIDRAMRVEPATASAELRDLRQLLEREMERMRTFIHQLRPPLDKSDGLAAALGDAARQFSDETGMAVNVELSAPEAMLDLPRRTAVLRVALEALRNARKHSGAAEVCVSTHLEPSSSSGATSSWVLEVRDDGHGFAVGEAMEAATRRHFGLRFMRERAQLVGAGLEIVSDQAAGTTVRLRLDPNERS